jgi:hypothetical protein
MYELYIILRVVVSVVLAWFAITNWWKAVRTNFIVVKKYDISLRNPFHIPFHDQEFKELSEKYRDHSYKTIFLIIALVIINFILPSLIESYL